MKKERTVQEKVVNQKKHGLSPSPRNVRTKNKPKEISSKDTSAKENVKPNQQQDSLKVCLDLANYHKKEAEEMKIKNIELEKQLEKQAQSMKHLRKQLEKIKVVFDNNLASQKEIQQLLVFNRELETLNTDLKKQLDSVKGELQSARKQIQQLKTKELQTESILVDESGCQQFDINSLTVAKQSRRQELANRYEGIAFIPSKVCLSCCNKDAQLESLRQQHKKQVRQLTNININFQKDLSFLQRQRESSQKCIDYLSLHLSNSEKAMTSVLQKIDDLQGRWREMTLENQVLKTQSQQTGRTSQNFSKVAF